MSMTEQSDISSSELTAFWRSQDAEISNDSESQLLVSDAGIKKANEFVTYFNAPLIPRLICVRANFMLQEACQLLASNAYDSCISLASGFSSLTYQIARQCGDKYQYVDTDLSYIIDHRRQRLLEQQDKLELAFLDRIKLQAFDIEQAFVAGKSLKECFPMVESPIFVLEGIIYFLSESCAYWLYEEIASFKRSSIIMDYWPKAVEGISDLANRVYVVWNETMPEKSRNSYIDDKQMEKITSLFPQSKSLAVDAYEASIVKQAKLINQDEFFPIHLLRGAQG